MTSREQLHDLASRRRRLAVEVDPSPIYDLLLSLWSALGDDEKSDAHDVGQRWFEEFRTKLPASALDEMRAFGGDQGEMWQTVLAGVAAEAPWPRDPEAVLAWLASPGFAVVRNQAVREASWQAGEEQVEAALVGDPEAISACCELVEQVHGEPARTAVEALLTREPAELGGSIAAALRAVRQETFAPHEKAWSDALAASAEDARRLAADLEPSPLIERLTNGISYELPLGTTRLVLIPSVSLRPWTLVTDFGSAIIIVYPVADEHLQADPDAPPSWMVKFYKALGDERRMRMLRRLAEGDATLAELTELLGLAKSTVFHHIGVLRSAGLVRVRLSRDKQTGPVYALRHGAFTDARRVLDDYLTPPEEIRREGAQE